MPPGFVVRAAQKGDSKKEPTRLPEAKNCRVRRGTAASYAEWLMIGAMSPRVTSPDQSAKLIAEHKSQPASTTVPIGANKKYNTIPIDARPIH
jgi:hypothetical protein